MKETISLNTQEQKRLLVLNRLQCTDLDHTRSSEAACIVHGELGQEHPAEVWVTFFEHISQYDRLYRALLGSKGSPWFVRKMRDALTELIKQRGQHPHGPNIADHPVHSFSDVLVSDLVSTLFVEAITWWLEQGRSYTPREIAARSALLAAALFNEASTWQ